MNNCPECVHIAMNNQDTHHILCSHNAVNVARTRAQLNAIIAGTDKCAICGESLKDHLRPGDRCREQSHYRSA